MKINSKIQLENLKINFNFYYFLKKLNGTPKFTSKEIRLILDTCLLNEKSSFKVNKFVLESLSSKFVSQKLDLFSLILIKIQTKLDLEIFIFALQLIEIKPLLLEESKMVDMSSINKSVKSNNLSLEYDENSKSTPYYTRVNGALLVKLFFEKLDKNETNFISELTVEYLNSMFNRSSLLIQNGVQPNQIFMLMFNESLNQSIISDSGSNYEQRVLSILLNIGIQTDKISKIHDIIDKSTEYDFYFEFENRIYGIGAKRTLRERYKQFIKTAQTTKIDVTIEFTLGIDLTEQKAKTIRSHNTYLIISDEVYFSRKYLQNIIGIYPASEFSLNLLKEL